MADDNAARKIDDAFTRGERVLRLRPNSDPDPVYEEWLARTSGPEWDGVFEIPADKAHLLPDS